MIYTAMTILGKSAITGGVLFAVAVFCFFCWLACYEDSIDEKWTQGWAVAAKICIVPALIILFGCGFAGIWGVR